MSEGNVRENAKKLSFKVFDKDEIPQISQWFISLEGEGKNVGEPSLYLRFSGCFSAACKFCDTKFSWFKKQGNPQINDDVLLQEIANEFKGRDINRMTITGGEPMHYMKNLFNTIKWINSSPKINIKDFGVESNGNILRSEMALITLIKEFKKIKDLLNVTPVLTISPKLDPEDCYNNMLSQEEIDELYFQVYRNIQRIFSFQVNFKFIWGISEKQNEKVKEHIYKLKQMNFKTKHIFIMPFTPNDPMGSNYPLWNASKIATANKAIELGVRYSPRIHIDGGLD